MLSKNDDGRVMVGQNDRASIADRNLARFQKPGKRNGPERFKTKNVINNAKTSRRRFRTRKVINNAKKTSHDGSITARREIDGRSSNDAIRNGFRHETVRFRFGIRPDE